MLKTRRLELGIVGAVAALDQLTKYLVVAGMELYETIPVVNGLLNLTHIRNTGVAFGLFNSAEFAYKPVVVSLLALAAIFGVGLYAMQLPPGNRLARVGLALILGGAAGNLVDRARQGYVVDFVDAYWNDWHFWAFNVADAAITVGVGLLIIDLFRPEAAAAAAPASPAVEEPRVS
jgi:signal peptidase II